MAKRAREFLTPEVRRTLVTRALNASGLQHQISYKVACSVAKLPINGIRNQRALELAIVNEIVLQTAKEKAWLERDFEPVPSSTRRGLRLIVGGRA